jgi:hypothetical protein
VFAHKRTDRRRVEADCQSPRAMPRSG